MQIIENTSAALVHVPTRYAPAGASAALAPGESTRFDFARFAAEKPDSARLLGTYLAVREEGGARVETPAPALAVAASSRSARAAKKESATTARTDPFAGLSEAEALELVPSENDRDMLTDWRGVEDRAAVRTAIDARLEALKC